MVIVDTTPPDQPVIGEVIDDEGPIQGAVDNGGSTDDTTPTLVGKGEPGDTIVVIDNGTPVGETEVDEDGNWSFTPDTPLDEGEHEFTVVERDPAGNESRPSEPHVVVVDTTAPDQPVIGEVIDDVGLVQGPVGNGESTDDTTPTLVGKGEPGDTIVVIDNGTPVGETKVDEDGNWSFTPDTPLDEGEHEFTVVERDPAGNESRPSEPHVVLVDTTPPDQPVIGEVIDDVGLVQGPVGNGESTDDTTPTLVGKGEPGDTIVVIDNGTPVGETEVDEDGNWSFTPDTPLDEGEHEFTVVERDPAGNESRPSEPHVVIVDTTAPDQPVIGEVIDDVGLVQGPVGNGESTDDTTPTLVGKGEPGDTIVVIDNGTPVGETEVDEDGNWSFTPDTPLDEGEHEFTVVERDPAGNESRPSEPHVVIVDTTAPDQPVIGEVIDDVGLVQGPVGNGESTDDTTPTLVGKGEPGDTIVVIDNGTPVGETKVDEDGNWSFTPDTPLDEGEHEFTVVERDPAGNESRPSEPHVVIVDTTAPDQPVIGEVIDDVGLVQGPVGNGESTDDTTPTLVGKGEPGDTIVVIDNGTPVGETEVDEDGNWSFTPDTPLDEGEHEFTVVERDPAGNESRPSEPHVVIVDTTPPDQPVIGEVIDDVGLVQGPVGNGESTDDTTPTLVGKGEPGDTIVVIDNGTPVGETEVDEDGNWSFTPDTPLDEGEHEFTVVERDPAGNESRPSEPHVVVVDTTAPDQPVIGEVIDDVGLVQGPVGNGESTDDTTPTLVGKGEPGDTIVVIDNGTPVGETEVDEDGNWSFTPDTPLDEGEHEFTVVERDPAGNESRPSEPHVVIVDTTAPDQPVIGEVIDDVGLVQGPVGNGESTDDTTPTLVGKGEPGDTIVVIDNGTPVGETEVDEDGNWSFTPDTPLDEGEHEFTVVERDPAGNESRPSEPHVVVVDTTPPDQPVIGEVIDDEGPIQGAVDNGGSTDDTTPTLVGKGEPGDTIVVIDNGTPVGETEVDEDGNWSFTPDTPLDEGEHEFTVVERDPAGNESRPSEPWTVIVEPREPVLAHVTYMGKDSGTVDFLTHDGSAGRLIMGSLTAELAAGEMVQVSTDDGKTWHDALIDDKGNWLFQDDTAHVADWTIQTRVADAYGNSGEVVSQDVALETTGPGAPISWEVRGNKLVIVLPEGAAAGDRVIYNNATVNSIESGYELTPSDIASGIAVVDCFVLEVGSWISAVGLVDGAGNLYLNTHHHEDFETVTWSIGADQKLIGFNGFTLDSTKVNGYSSSGGDRGLVLGPKGALVSESINIELEDPASSVSLRLSKVGIGSGNYIAYLDAAGHEIGRTAITASTGSVDYHFDAPLNGEPIATVKLVFGFSQDSVSLLDFSFDTVVNGLHACYGPFVGDDESNVFQFGQPELGPAFTEAIGLASFQGGSVSFDGEGGIDTLKLSGAGLTLDLLNEHHGKLSSIEVFDITGTGNNTLRLSLGDVLDLGGKDLFVADGRTQVMVKGNAGDKVDLSDLLPDGGDVGNWMQQSGTTTVGGVAYDVFYHSGLNAELLVQHGVDTTLLNH
ncbi:hypothetical protein OKW46_004833 [Paraburkholderia sp. WSM4179]|nr:hypothetical protein [Paraburkholderia sp. WSM4179]